MADQKVILAFGDSGANAETGGRHAYADRWPTVLEAGLGGLARVIPEGLGGRTTVFDDFSAAADRNGGRILPTLLASHAPLDLVILFLGTNDLKPYVNGSALGAAHGIRRLVEIVRTHQYPAGASAPAVIIVAPPLLVPSDHPELNPMFSGGVTLSGELLGHYQRAARDLNVTLFDAGKVATATPIDGVHLDAANTRAIGKGLVPVVKQVLAL
jgi:lysophospholipase L1-like esterase